jgi:hypothetical protein
MFGTADPDRDGRPMKGPLRVAMACLASLCTVLVGAAAALPARAQPAAEERSATRSTVARVVAGIVSYTRWPSAAPSIRLCTVGPGPGVDALLHAADLGSPGRSVSVVPVASLQAVGDACDAVYLGRARDVGARQAVRQFAGRPVLVIGEGPEFCSDGGMFCVDLAAEVPRFGVNLDAVARSGLRVNPQVLRIARGGEGQGS